jgi:hypothetical protein
MELMRGLRNQLTELMTGLSRLGSNEPWIVPQFV